MKKGKIFHDRSGPGDLTRENGHARMGTAGVFGIARLESQRAAPPLPSSLGDAGWANTSSPVAPVRQIRAMNSPLARGRHSQTPASIAADSSRIAVQTGMDSSRPRMIINGANRWPTTIRVAQAGPSSAGGGGFPYTLKFSQLLHNAHHTFTHF